MKLISEDERVAQEARIDELHFATLQTLFLASRITGQRVRGRGPHGDYPLMDVERRGDHTFCRVSTATPAWLRASELEAFYFE